MSKDAMSILMQALLRTYVFISLEYIPGDSTFLDEPVYMPRSSVLELQLLHNLANI
jgi:hypothetical protein